MQRREPERQIPQIPIDKQPEPTLWERVVPIAFLVAVWWAIVWGLHKYAEHCRDERLRLPPWEIERARKAPR